MSVYEIAIIGAGPAGASAGLFAAKAGKKTVVIDNDKGMTKRGWYENMYGILEMTGPELVETGRKQVAKFGGELVDGTVTEIVKTADGFLVKTDESEYAAKHVILATGVSVELAERIGVATKPGSEPRIKTVIDVDGGGKSSVEGIWAAGTVAGVSVHAVITAGDGAKVAINVISELNGARYVDHDLMKA